MKVIKHWRLYELFSNVFYHAVSDAKETSQNVKDAINIVTVDKETR